MRNVIVAAFCFALLTQCSTAGSQGAMGYAASQQTDLGACARSPIKPNRQDQLCNRQNGNPYQ